MPILNIQLNEPGQSGIWPRIIRIETNDPVATVVAAGYLTDAVKSGLISLDERDMALVVTQETPSGDKEVGWYEVSYVSGAWSLVPPSNPGDVILPTVANRLAHFTNTTGTLSGAAADVVNLGDLTLGASGTEGILNLFPTTAAKGSLIVKAIANTGNDSVTISNAAHGQATVISIPDGGQATAEFIISDSAGTQHITSGGLQVDDGAISSGLAAGGFAGNLILHANTTASGNLALLAVDNAGGDFDTVISNAASIGQDQVISIPDGGQATSEFIIADSAGTQHITSGNLQVDAGGYLAGLAAGGTAGSLTLFPATTANGSLIIAAINAGADFDTTINNAASVGQDQVITIPDSGAATANFLLDAGAANLIAHQQFVGISDVLTFGTGTWTLTRIAQGNYVSRHTAGDETSIIGIDITPMIRVAAGKGFRLDSFDYIYSITTNPLDAHSAVLDRIEYADNAAVSVNSIAITGTAATATQANPYVTNFTIDTPAFDITADSKYVLEITVNHAAASDFDYYGIMLRFSQTIA